MQPGHIGTKKAWSLVVFMVQTMAANPTTSNLAEHHVNGTRGPCEEGGRTPKCHHVCENTAYTKKYKEDLTFGQKV